MRGGPISIMQLGIMAGSKTTSKCPCLEVRIGKRKRVVAGVRSGGVSLMVSWGDKPNRKKLKVPAGELVLVGCTSGETDEFAHWGKWKLKPGDEIVLQCIRAVSPDRPLGEHRYDPKVRMVVKVRGKSLNRRRTRAARSK